MTLARRITGLQRGAGAPFDPADLSLIAWYDFSVMGTLFTDGARTTPVASDGDAINGVTDLSGAGNHLDTAGGGSAAVYKTAIINGLDVGRFTNDELLLPSGSPITVAQPFTIIVALKLTTAFSGLAGNCTIVAAHDAVPQQSGGQASNKWGIYAGAQLESSVNSETTNPHCFVTVFNGASSKVRVDGTETSGNAGSTGFSSDRLAIGAYGLEADVGEVLVTDNVVTGTDLSDVETYIQDKWATP